MSIARYLLNVCDEDDGLSMSCFVVTTRADEMDQCRGRGREEALETRGGGIAVDPRVSPISLSVSVSFSWLFLLQSSCLPGERMVL